MRKQWAVVFISALTLVATALPTDPSQFVDGTQLDVQSLTIGVKEKSLKSFVSLSTATVSGQESVPFQEVPMVVSPSRASSNLAPVGPSVAEAGGTSPPEPGQSPTITTTTTDDGSGATNQPQLPGTPPPAGLPAPPPRVVPLAYEVTERRPDFIYRPGRLEFQSQPTYNAAQTGLAVGPGVRPGQTRFVPVGSF
ncbi:MAG: hypothetical protein U0931_34665 [Vulcanimicrobiota bacterium]